MSADWGGKRLRGRVAIALRNTGPRPLREVWLRTWPNFAGGCDEPLVRLEMVAGGSLGGARAGCTAREVRLREPLPRGARTRIELRYSVEVPVGADRFGRGRDVAYLGNAIPTLAVADEDGWRLAPYFDQGEAWFSLTARWEVNVAAPQGQTVVTTGRESAPGVYEAAAARDFMIVVGRLRETRSRVGDISVRHFRLPGQPRSHARRALRAAGAALSAFQRWYGPYGRDELDVVQGPAEIATRGIAMEYPELILTPPSAGAVVHEVAHQWWAFIVANDPYREPFLDEGLAEYSASRLPSAITGGDRLAGCPRPRRPPRPPISADVPALQRAGGRAYVRTAYIGAACMLRRLERALGRGRFDDMLRGIVADRRDGTWTRGDLIAAVERAAPEGFDVDAFLEREAVTRPRG